MFKIDAIVRIVKVVYLHAFINLKVPSNRSGVVKFLLVKNEIATARYMEMRCRGGIVPQ